MFERRLVIFSTIFILLAAACGPEESATSSISMPLTGDYGEIFLSWEQPIGESEEEVPPPFHVSARFVRVRDLGRQDVRSLWGEELPVANSAWNECELTEVTAEPLRDHLLGGSLELLDAGEMSLQLAGEEMRVPSLSFPSVYGVVAGVLYGGEDVAIELLPDSEYRLASSGSEEIGAFELSVIAPEEFEGLTIAGIEADLEQVVLDVAQPIDVRWEPGRTGAEIIIELSYTQFGAEQRVVCRSQDDGVEDLSASVVRRLWDPDVSDASLTIHRVVRRSFGADGLDDGEAVFVVSATVPITL